MLSGGNPRKFERVDEVIELVLNNQSRLPELFKCLFSLDEIVRMRAGDGLEKICRQQPDWFKSFIDRLFDEVSKIDQSSVQWHLAQMLGEIELTPDQKQKAIKLLKARVSSLDVDWIVAANTMETLAQFVRHGAMPAQDLKPILKKQQGHHSKAVGRRATKLLSEFANLI